MHLTCNDFSVYLRTHHYHALVGFHGKICMFIGTSCPTLVSIETSIKRLYGALIYAPSLEHHFHNFRKRHTVSDSARQSTVTLCSTTSRDYEFCNGEMKGRGCSQASQPGRDRSYLLEPFRPYFLNHLWNASTALDSKEAHSPLSILARQS